MAYVDARGIRLDFDVSASAGIYRTMQVTADGSARDLTSETISVMVKDDKHQARDYGGQYGSETTYAQTITSAADGEFDFYIPPDEFTQKEGGQMTYEMKLTNSAGKPVGLAYGYLNILERG